MCKFRLLNIICCGLVVKTTIGVQIVVGSNPSEEHVNFGGNCFTCRPWAYRPSQAAPGPTQAVTVTGQSRSWWTVTVTGRPKPGPGPQADSVHRDSHAHVNRNPSLDHGWLVRTEL